MDRMAKDREKAEAKPEAKPEAKAVEPKEAKADAKAETPADDDAKPEAAEDEKKEGSELPEWMRKRMARTKRQAAEAKAERDEFAAKLELAQEMIDKLKAKTKKIDPADFEKFDDYKKAKAEQEAPVEEPEFDGPDRDAMEAISDIREALDAQGTGELWDQAADLGDDGNKRYLSRAMLLALAEELDTAAAFKALFDAGEDAAAELQEMAGSPRAQVRRMRQIIRDQAKGIVVEDAKPARDPATGQFKKTSSAPEPINPVTGGASGTRSIDKMSTDEFINHRNSQEKNAPRFGW
jgi:hypothetical protein